MDVESLITKIYEQVGRNVFLFQKLEAILKQIVRFNSFGSYKSDLKERCDKLNESINTKSMGLLLTDFFKTKEKSSFSEVNVSKESFISTQLELDPDFIESKVESLTKLLQERNNLVHHSHTRFDFKSVDSCQSTLAFLKRQEKRIQNEISSLSFIIEDIESFKTLLQEAFKTKEFKKEFFYGGMRLYVVDEIKRIYYEIMRDDTWASLNSLGKAVQENLFTVVEELKKQYNCNTLKQLLIELEYFELRVENSHVLFKIKAEYEV